jgi:hypothetical protein
VSLSILKNLSIKKKGLSLNLEFYRSFWEFIAQSEDLSLKHVSNASELIETDKEPKFLIEKKHSPA